MLRRCVHFNIVYLLLGLPSDLFPFTSIHVILTSYMLPTVSCLFHKDAFNVVLMLRISVLAVLCLRRLRNLLLSMLAAEFSFQRFLFLPLTFRLLSCISANCYRPFYPKGLLISSTILMT
jgi:hypothetical protein